MTYRVCRPQVLHRNGQFQFLFNRSAQSARPGGMDVKMKGRMDEGRQAKWWWSSRSSLHAQRKRSNANIHPRRLRNKVEKQWKTTPERSKIDPKSSQNGPKTKPRGTRNPTIVFKTTWEAPGGRFPGYPAPAECQHGGQNRTKTAKKQHKKSLNFWSHLWCEKWSKMVPKIMKNWPQDDSKSLSEESRSKKQEKCKNENKIL